MPDASTSSYSERFPLDESATTSKKVKITIQKKAKAQRELQTTVYEDLGVVFYPVEIGLTSLYTKVDELLGLDPPGTPPKPKREAADGESKEQEADEDKSTFQSLQEALDGATTSAVSTFTGPAATDQIEYLAGLMSSTLNDMTGNFFKF